MRSLFLVAALIVGAACAAHRQLRTSTVPVDVTHHLRRGDLPPDDRSKVASDFDVANCVAKMPEIPPAANLPALLEKHDDGDERDEGWGAAPCVAERRLGPLLLTCGPNVQRGNPFRVVRVAPNVQHQHNGFFNPYFLIFARDLVLGSLD